jgi:hypothetical protein
LRHANGAAPPQERQQEHEHAPNGAAPRQEHEREHEQWRLRVIVRVEPNTVGCEVSLDEVQRVSRVRRLAAPAGATVVTVTIRSEV